MDDRFGGIVVDWRFFSLITRLVVSRRRPRSG